MSRNIAIGIVTYNPDGNLISRLSLSLASGFDLYVFDNSPENKIINVFCRNRQNCKYFTCGKNVGLGFGLSTICAQAYYDSYPALLFFDQDTIFDRSTLGFVEDMFINKGNLAAHYSAIIFNSKNVDNVNTGSNFLLKDVLIAINSGSLYFLENLKKLNWHNESYFVDCVDYEFCLNSNNHGFKIAECSNTPGFDHKSEQGDVQYIIFGKKCQLRKYSPRRVFDTIYENTRLFFAAVRTGNRSFSYAIMRSLAIYLLFQVVVRLVNISKTKKEIQK
jgi:hypothetical protein